MLFVLSYTAYHFVFGLTIIYVVVNCLYTKNIDRQILSYAFFGIFLGVVLHPHFPNNILIWKVQNYDVLRLVWSGVQLNFGQEFYPLISRVFISNFTISFFIVPFLVFFALWRNCKISEDTFFFLILSFLFLVLTLMSARFIEYWPAFSIIASGCLSRDLYANMARNQNRHHTLLIVTLSIPMLFFFYRTVSSVSTMNSYFPPPEYKDAALWMKENLQDGETVFHSTWDEFPQLFFYNPDNYYLDCLDPIFMYVYDNTLWHVRQDIITGQSQQPHRDIRERFGARYAFFSKRYKSTLENLKKNQYMSILYEDIDCLIFEVNDEYDVEKKL